MREVSPHTEILIQVVDMLEEEQIDEMVHECVAKWGRVDYCVNAAGTFFPSSSSLYLPIPPHSKSLVIGETRVERDGLATMNDINHQRDRNPRKQRPLDLHLIHPIRPNKLYQLPRHLALLPRPTLPDDKARSPPLSRRTSRKPWLGR